MPAPEAWWTSAGPSRPPPATIRASTSRSIFTIKEFDEHSLREIARGGSEYELSPMNTRSDSRGPASIVSAFDSSTQVEDSLRTTETANSSPATVFVSESEGNSSERAESPHGDSSKEFFQRDFDPSDHNTGLSCSVFSPFRAGSRSFDIESFPIPPGIPRQNNIDETDSEAPEVVPPVDHQFAINSIKRYYRNAAAIDLQQPEPEDRYLTPEVWLTVNRARKLSIVGGISILVLSALVIGILAAVSKGEIFGKKEPWKFDLETGYTYTVNAPLKAIEGSCDASDPRLMWSCQSPLSTAFHLGHDKKNYVLNTAYQADGTTNYQRTLRLPTKEDPFYRFSFSTSFNIHNDCIGDYNMTVGLGKGKTYEVLVERTLWNPCTLGYSATVVKYRPQFCNCLYEGTDK